MMYLNIATDDLNNYTIKSCKVVVFFACLLFEKYGNLAIAIAIPLANLKVSISEDLN